MSNGIDWDLLTMYVLGECSEDEERQVERWLAKDPVHQDLLDDLRKVYKNTEKTSDQRISDEQRQDQTWAQVEAHMQQEEQGAQEEVRQEAAQKKVGRQHDAQSRSAKRRTARKKRVSRRFSRSAPRVAAVLAAVALLAVLSSQLQPGRLDQSSSSEVKSFITQRGERATIRLADSTRVRLNAESRLKVLSDFEAGAREVELHGEAYFEVTPNGNRPFLVHAGDATTEVLGTEFVVTAYSSAAKVIVAEGKVAFRPNAPSSRAANSSDEGNAREQVVLTRKQAARLSQGKQVIVSEVDLDAHLAWLSGELAFEDATFNEVARRLERQYDIDVRLSGSDAHGQLTARFSEDQPLNKVLTVVASVFDLEYRREGSVVTFSASG